MDLPGQFTRDCRPAGGKDGPVPGNDGERTVRGGHGQQLGFHDVAFFGVGDAVRAGLVRARGLCCRGGAPEVHGGVGAPGTELTEVRTQGRFGGRGGAGRGGGERADAVAHGGVVGQEDIRGADHAHRHIAHRPRPDAGERQQFGLQPGQVVAVAEIELARGHRRGSTADRVDAALRAAEEFEAGLRDLRCRGEQPVQPVRRNQALAPGRGQLDEGGPGGGDGDLLPDHGPDQQLLRVHRTRHPDARAWQQCWRPAGDRTPARRRWRPGRRRDPAAGGPG